MVPTPRWPLALLVLLTLRTAALADERTPPMLTPEEQNLAVEATKLSDEAVRLHQRGRPAEAVPKMWQCLEIRQNLYPASKYPSGHRDLATSLNHLGLMLQAMGQAEQALPYYQRGLAMREQLFPAAQYPGGHPDLAASLNNPGFVWHAMGEVEKAMPFCQQSLAMRQQLFPVAKYPDGHPDLATSLNNLGFVLQAMGQAEQALPYYRQSLDMRQKLYPAATYPAGHPDLATGINNLGGVLKAIGQVEQALPHYRQALAMYQQLYPAAKFPDGHPILARSFNNMGSVLDEMGQTEQALPYFRRALAMYQQFYPAATFPNGHPSLASSLNNLGVVLKVMGQAEQALPYYRQALAMYQQLYPAAMFPDGHPGLARSLNNLGGVLQAMGQTAEALSHYRRALAMYQRLYPAAKYPGGHPDLAASLNNLGLMLQAMGQAEEAAPFYRQSLDMRQQLFPAARYPDGHPDLATSLDNLGGVLEAMGKAEHALPLHRQSLEMQQRLLRRELATASEEAAFDKIKAESPFRDAYLSVTAARKTGGDDVFPAVWPSRSMVTRLLEQRQANARAAGTAAGDKLNRLRGLRRRTDQLLQDIRMTPEARDKLLVGVANERDRLERELVAEIPALQRWQDLDKLGPPDLARALPPGAAFIDVIRYTRSEYVDRTQTRTPSYVAFVVAPGRAVERVELGPAGPLDAAVAAWRGAIDAGRGPAPAGGAAELAQRVWGPLARALPPGTTAVYLAPDGDLARLPWAALPVGPGRVLLEDLAVAQVPHGLFLLDQLRAPPAAAGPAAVLAVGGVEYGAGPWPPLPGTAAEAAAVAALAPGRLDALTKADATAARLAARLPHARYAHLATHGAFRADDLTAERKRAAAALDARLRGDDTRAVAAKNPLGYVGLVLANGEVLSGLGIVDLPLQQLRLVTLSACETGLGELTGGEGVQGLQRAFHLAGCPNVVASLWKVSDAATAALMAQFYHELWVAKRPPIEALRQAQLTIYRHPDRIGDLAGERGAPRLKAAAEGKPSEPPASAGGGARANTRLWAGFVLSGAGR